jgi:hypothetical protein
MQRPILRLTFWLLCGVGALSAPSAMAQDSSLDAKLRDLLRQTTEQLRAAQDNAASLQASLDSVTKQRDSLQQQLAAAPPPAAAPAAPSPQQQAQTARADLLVRAAQAEVARYAAGVQHWQAAYQQAAAVARERDATAKQSAASLAQARTALSTCTGENGKLITLAGEILHLYQTPKWNELLVANHERLLGFARVRLENLVQDYDDKIDEQSYVAPAAH